MASLEKEPDKIEQLLVKTGAMALAKLLLVYNHDRLYAMLSFLLTNPTAVLFPTFREAFRLLNLTKNDPFCEYRKTVIVGLIIKIMQGLR
ncbi:MAG: hypothetical protein HWD59_13500 [Coxiellaceae bacterium]|nr:MAG: hypothetical protein HWD59_13500 [Coxiellaceae bacterium]